MSTTNTDFVQRYQLPRFYVLGQGATPTWDIYDAAGDQQTITSGTFTLKQGAEVLLDGVSLTAGPPATYTVPSTTFDGRALTGDLLERINVVIGGVDRVFTRPAYLCRSVYVPTITDTDLTTRHSELADWLSARSDITSYQKYRDEANVMIQTRLLETGRRPYLVFDQYAFRLPHINLTLHLIFQDAETSVGNGKYRRLAELYEKRWMGAWDRLRTRLDEDQSGDIGADELNPHGTSNAVVPTAGNTYRWQYSRPWYSGRYSR